MTLEQLKKARKVTGIKQVTKAICKDQVSSVLLGTDADGRVAEPLKNLCKDKNIPVEIAFSMAELGKACSIHVGAAAVAILKQGHC